MWVSAGEGVVRGGTLVLPSVRTHHAVRYACSQGTETSPRVIVRLVVHEPLTVTVTPNPLVSTYTLLCTSVKVNNVYKVNTDKLFFSQIISFFLLM